MNGHSARLQCVASFLCPKAFPCGAAELRAALAQPCCASWEQGGSPPAQDMSGTQLLDQDRLARTG